MAACDFSAFEKFDVGACLHSIAFGWVPDWAWALLPYWPWIVIVSGAGMAYRFGGWLGVTAFFGGVGFIAGRKSVEVKPPIVPDEPVRRAPTKPKRKTFLDALRGITDDD